MTPWEAVQRSAGETLARLETGDREPVAAAPQVIAPPVPLRVALGSGDYRVMHAARRRSRYAFFQRRRCAGSPASWAAEGGHSRCLRKYARSASVARAQRLSWRRRGPERQKRPGRPSSNGALQ